MYWLRKTLRRFKGVLFNCPFANDLTNTELVDGTRWDLRSFVVDSSDLTPDQAERLFAIVARDVEFLNRLLARMRAAGFPDEDSLHRACRDAVAEMRSLYLIVNELRRNGVQRDAVRLSKLWAPL